MTTTPVGEHGDTAKDSAKTSFAGANTGKWSLPPLAALGMSAFQESVNGISASGRNPFFFSQEPVLSRTRSGTIGI